MYARLIATLLLPALLAAAGCAGPGAGREPTGPDTATAPAPSSPLTDPAYRRLESRGGRYTLCWRPAADEVPRNQTFDLEVWLYEGQLPVRGAQLFVRGWMPDHAHGMLHAPTAVEQGNGGYRVRGVLLHMRGLWQLFFDILRDGQADVAECELRL